MSGELEGLRGPLAQAHLAGAPLPPGSAEAAALAARATVEERLQAHHPLAAPILAAVWERVDAWVRENPPLLGVVREPGGGRLELHPLSPRDEEHPRRLLRAGQVDELFAFLAGCTHDVCAFFAIEWTRAHADDPRCRAAAASLDAARAALPAGVPDEAAREVFSPTRNTIEGFVTAVGFLWNLHRVELDLARAEAGRLGLGAAALLRQLAANDLELTALVASCRKDVFIALNERLQRHEPEDAGAERSRVAPFDADHFRLAGDAAAGTLHLELAPPVCAWLAALRAPALEASEGRPAWPLPRLGCPARGAVHKGMHDWLRAALDRHVGRHLG